MKIYRFRNISVNTYRELITRKVWFSKYAYLNDPFEGVYINNTEQNDYDELIKNYEICSYSKKKNNLLMWAHYADSHKGICLEYDIDDAEYKKRFFEVSYSKAQPVIKEVRKDAHGMVKMQEASEFQVFLTKSCDWKYEKEVRVIQQNLFGSRGSLVEELGSLSGVYFGLNASDQIIDDFDNILKEDQNISFYQSGYKKNKYKLKFSKIKRPTNLTITISSYLF